MLLHIPKVLDRGQVAECRKALAAAEWLLPPTAILRQTFTNQLAVWAVLNALLSLAATRFFGTRAPAG